jgi:hypothetical protein
MEMFGILFSMPAAFVASITYGAILRRLSLPALLRQAATWASAGILGALVAEWTLLATIGTVASRAALGPAFYVVHIAIFFLAVPSLVNLLVLKGGDTVLGWWVTVGVLSGMLALPLVLTQYGVSEALYGIDGQGGPYGAL